MTGATTGADAARREGTRGGADCSHCGLPLPDPPATADGVDGRFCCRGCLEVARAFDDAGAGVDAARGQADGDADGETGAAEAVRAALGDGDASDPADAAGATPEDATETFLAVEGMHCTTCEAFLEGRAAAAPGVHEAEANYAADLLRVVHDEASGPEGVAEAVGGYGYRTRPVEDDPRGEDRAAGRLLVGGFFGMMTMLWYVLFLYPTYLGVDPSALLLDVSGLAGRYLIANLWVMSGVVLGYTGYPILRGAYVSVRAGAPNTDLLVALAACSAYAYSTAVALLGGTEVYFDVAVVIVLAVTLGDRYETRIKRAAAGHLREVARDRVETARRRTGSGVEEVPVERLSAGDAAVVREGERIPADGTVTEGSGTVDESLVTGESLPVEKEPGDDAVGGSRVVSGGVTVRVAEGSTLDRLVSRLWRIQSAEVGPGPLADRLASAFVPLVLALGVLAAGWRLAAGAGATTAVLAGVTVLVVSCPCALGLATPLATAKGIRAALDRGVVVTDGAAFERARDVDVVALDKTGTLTTGEMTVRETVGDPAAIARAAAVEALVDHPVAAAVAGHVDSPAGTVESVERHRRGASGVVDGERVLVGHPDLFAERGYATPEPVADLVERAEASGAVPTLVGVDGAVRAGLAVGDEPRPEWEAAVERLAEGARIVVLTGDDRGAAARFTDHPAIDEGFADLPPDGKVAVVDRLAASNTVAMVGDGVNDAPALAAADLGVAVGGGAALATDAADAVVTRDDLRAVPDALELFTATRGRIRTNLGWAFCYNAVALPLALAGALNPLLAAVAMATSSLLVVGSSTRRLTDAAEG